jgi:surface protein
MNEDFDFVKPMLAPGLTKYKTEQKELIDKALHITGGDPLNTLKYIVSSLAHEGRDVELILVIKPEFLTSLALVLPIVETEPKDELGYYVSWGDGTITHGTAIHQYSKVKLESECIIRIFGMGIAGLGGYNLVDDPGASSEILNDNDLEDNVFSNPDTWKPYYNGLIKVVSFGDLGHNFTSLRGAFYNCKKLVQVPETIPKSVTDTSHMFVGCVLFNHPINTWDTSSITNMSNMFQKCRIFNQPLDSWDTHNVTNMNHMFRCCNKFNQPLSSWNTGSVTSMQLMFDCCCEFNQPLDSWDTGSVRSMQFMFSCCDKFNQPLSSWNTGSVRSMQFMFIECYAFNQPLETWDTSSVKNMSYMFVHCKKFNQPLHTWDTKNVYSMEGMFQYCSEFNQPLNMWSTNKNINMDKMFNGCCKFDAALFAPIKN